MTDSFVASSIYVILLFLYMDTWDYLSSLALVVLVAEFVLSQTPCSHATTKFRLFTLHHKIYLPRTVRNPKIETMNKTPTAADPDKIINRAPSDMPLDFPGETGSKRRIRFASTVSTTRVLSRYDFSEDEKTDYWIEARDFTCLQSRARKVVMAMKKHGSASVDFIEDSYKEAQQLSELMVDDDEIDLFFGDPSCYTEKMEMWTESNYGQRGLEMYISPLQQSQRESGNRETRRMVLVAAKMGVRGGELADPYAALSWTTCIYSRMLGHADSTAAYLTECTPEQPKPVQMPVLKEETHPEETHSESAIRDLKLKVVQRLKLNTPSQDLEALKQTHVESAIRNLKLKVAQRLKLNTPSQVPVVSKAA
jgi:hypothetical protein